MCIPLAEENMSENRKRKTTNQSMDQSMSQRPRDERLISSFRTLDDHMRKRSNPSPVADSLHLAPIGSEEGTKSVTQSSRKLTPSTSTSVRVK